MEMRQKGSNIGDRKRTKNAEYVEKQKKICFMYWKNTKQRKTKGKKRL